MANIPHTNVSQVGKIVHDDDSSVHSSVKTSQTGSSKNVLNKMRSKADHLASDLSRIGVAISTTWNPNHRHDDPWEKEVDDKLMAIRDSHSFRSFAPEREHNIVKWHIDGHGEWTLKARN